jgi:O-antigen biosynthesis protein
MAFFARAPRRALSSLRAARASIQTVIGEAPPDEAPRRVLWERFRAHVSMVTQDMRGKPHRFKKGRELKAEIERAVPIAQEMREEALLEQEFQLPSAPLVSIIIPIYGKLDLTVTCLLSILSSQDKTSYEIIVADDASPDRSGEVLSKVRGIRYVRNPENLGFLRSCNRAATFARGQWVYFLNNDTIVLPGFLDRLVETTARIKNAGIVGSKLIFPTLDLQECGGIVWKNGAASNLGYGRDPFNPSYGYLRDADYVSFASALVNKRFFDQVGGFDEQFCPAYYEDTDLAFEARKAGYRVLVQPASRIIHFEGGTMGRDVAQGLKKYQVDNQKKFLEKWATTLSSYGSFLDTNFRIRDRHSQKNILVLARGTPRPDEDSGSIDMVNMLSLIRGLGHAVTFMPVRLSPRGTPWVNVGHHDGTYSESLEQIGIECLHSPYEPSAERYLREHGAKFDAILVQRGRVLHRFLGAIQKYAPQAKLIFNTVDLHYLREEREGALLKSSFYKFKAKDTKWRELAAVRAATTTLVLSEVEREILSQEVPGKDIRIVPLIRDIPGRSAGFHGRTGVLFVGGFRHRPNVDAMKHFLAEVWPLVQTRRPDLHFWIVGSNMPKEVSEVGSETVHALGYVPDLSELYSRVCVSVAPLRYGAGLKGKVAESLSYGVPCVTTSVGAEGSGLEDGRNIVVRDEPKAMAEAIIALHSSPEIWESLSQNGLEFVEAEYGLSANERRLARILDGVPE